MRFKKLKIWSIILILTGMVGVNWVSWNHAKRMTHFVESGKRTKSPEDLTTLEKIPLLLFGITVPRPQVWETPAEHDLAYQIVFINSGEHRLEGWLIEPQTMPSHGTILLFHGYAGAKDNLLLEAKSFSQMGYATVLVDFRGSGGSTGQETTVGYREAEDVVATFRFVQQQEMAGPIILYGMSMGGAAVTRAMSTADIQPDGIIIEALFDEMLSTVENRFDAMGIPSFPAAQLLIFWGGIQSGFNGFEHNPADYAEKITVPVLMLHGKNDPRATLPQGERLFTKLATSDKKMVVFEEAGHESGIQIDQGLWEAEVEAFVSKLQDSSCKSPELCQ